MTDRGHVTDVEATAAPDGPLAEIPPADRRRDRHDAKLAAIVAEAWALARRDGLAAISLRDLADRVGLRQPSLYAYFDSKLALYDAMFAQANRSLVEAAERVPEGDDPRASLVAFVEAMVRFSNEDVVRHQLLFQAAIPGFEPSPESYAIALEFYGIAQRRLAAAGVTAPEGVDVFSALVGGLTHQQVANDPGGDRWLRLVPRVVDMFLADVDRRSDRRSKR